MPDPLGNELPDSLAVRLLTDYGLTVRASAEVRLGADRNAQLWRVVDTSGRTWAVKTAPSGSDASLRLMGVLARHSGSGVPLPRTTTQGALTSRTGDRQLSVVPWVDGPRGYGDDPGAMGLREWTGLGRLLGGVHRLDVPGDLAALLPREDYDPTSTLVAVHQVDRTLRQADMAGRAPIALWQQAFPDIAELASAVELLGAHLRARSAPEVLCHTDPHLYNVVVPRDPVHGTVVLLDWDDAMVSAPERDLAFVLGGGIIAERPVTTPERAAFLTGYGPYRADPERLAYFAGARALWDAADWTGAAVDVTEPDAVRSAAARCSAEILDGDGQVARALTLVRAL